MCSRKEPQYLSAVSATFYIPLLGRIYASRQHTDILYDEMALSISDKLPESIKEMPGQTEYSSLASAVRSINYEITGGIIRYFQ